MLPSKPQKAPRAVTDIWRQALKLQKRAAAVGFDWPDAHGALDKVIEEAGEVRAELKSAPYRKLESEVGDLLFAALNVARLSGVDPEKALTRCCDKFTARFRKVKALARKHGKPMLEHTLAELDVYWEEAKRRET